MINHSVPSCSECVTRLATATPHPSDTFHQVTPHFLSLGFLLLIFSSTGTAGTEVRHCEGTGRDHIRYSCRERYGAPVFMSLVLPDLLALGDIHSYTVARGKRTWSLSMQQAPSHLIRHCMSRSAWLMKVTSLGQNGSGSTPSSESLPLSW